MTITLNVASDQSVSASIPTPIPPTRAAPVSNRTAAVILGTMVLLIVALTATLIDVSLRDGTPVAAPVTIEPTTLAER